MARNTILISRRSSRRRHPLTTKRWPSPEMRQGTTTPPLSMRWQKRRGSLMDARVSAQKRNKQQDSLHKASHLIAHKLVERTVVVGDLSQRQMVTKEHQEKNRHRNRAVYNDWGVYGFVQMLVYSA